MSEIKNRIKEDLKEAMREHNEIAKNTLKGALAAFVNEAIALGKKPTDDLNEEESLKVLKRLEKQRKDAIEKYKEGSRHDLVENESAELEVLKKYLPEMMPEEEIRKIALAKKEELSIDDPSKKGILMGQLMKELKGQADGSTVKKVVDELFY